MGQDKARASAISLLFKSDEDRPLWRYHLMQDGGDVWMNAVWAHAAADGLSMLRFLQTVVAALTGCSVPFFSGPGPHHIRRQPMLLWFIRFVAEHYLQYVRLAEEGLHPPGVAWLTIPVAQGISLRETARAECGSFAAWLAAAVAKAFCEQQGVSSGRVLLNLPNLRDNLNRVGGFGFGVGSLLIPVKIAEGASLISVGRRVAKRLKEMTSRGWDQNFDRFLGKDPARHLRFATLHARGQSAPIISISWKGADWPIGAEDGIRDLACFAASPVAHVSAHIDRNGLSLSVASRQSAAEREELLRRVADRLGGGPVDYVLGFDENSHGPVRCPRSFAGNVPLPQLGSS